MNSLPRAYRPVPDDGRINPRLVVRPGQRVTTESMRRRAMLTALERDRVFVAAICPYAAERLYGEPIRALAVEIIAEEDA